MARHRRMLDQAINILVDKAVDGHVDKLQKPSIIEDFKLFALILGNLLYQ